LRNPSLKSFHHFTPCCLPPTHNIPQFFFSQLELKGGISATQTRQEEKDSYSVSRRDFTPQELNLRAQMINQLNGIEEDEEEEEEEEQEVQEEEEEGESNFNHNAQDGNDSESGLSDA
jgi:hypothetical protein